MSYFEIPKTPIRNIEPSGGDFLIMPDKEKYLNFGMRFGNAQETHKAKEEMRKINRLRKFLWDTQEELDPEAKEEDKKYTVDYNIDKFIVRKHNNSLLPKATEKVARYVAERLNKGIMKL